jgi:hypothetical protein
VDRELERRCFVCGIDSNSFQRHSRGFDYHIRHEHDMWAYVFVRQYLREKDPSHYTGQESYLMHRLQEHDLKFMPVGKAICMEGAMGMMGQQQFDTQHQAE